MNFKQPLFRIFTVVIACFAGACAHQPNARPPGPSVDLKTVVPLQPSVATTGVQETAITLQSYSLVGYEKSDHCMAGKPNYFGKNDIGPTEYVSRAGYELLHSAVFKGPYWVCESYTRRSLVSLYDRAGLDFSEDPQIKLDHATKSDYRLWIPYWPHGAC